MNEKRRRLARTTRQQFDEMIQFVEKNAPIVIKGRNSPENARKLAELWEQFARHVNSKGIGPIKTIDQWKRILLEWKENTRRKYKQIMRAKANGSPEMWPGSRKTLSDIERRVLAVFSKYQPEPQKSFEQGTMRQVNELNGVPAEEAIDIKPIEFFTCEDVVITQVTSDNSVAESMGEGNGALSVSDRIFQPSSTSNVFVEPVFETPVAYANTNQKVAENCTFLDGVKEASKKITEAQGVYSEAAKKQSEAVEILTSAVNKLVASLEQKNEILKDISAAKLLNAEANLLRAKNEEMNTRIKLMRYLAGATDR